MSITKISLVLLAVVFLMPTPPEPNVSPVGASVAPPAPAPRMIDAASDALSDMSEFCGRQPAVCEAAGHLLHKLEAKAKYSVRLLYEWANDSSVLTPESHSDRQEAEVDPLTTSSTVADIDHSSGTLRIEDLVPEWRAPKPLRRG